MPGDVAHDSRLPVGILMRVTEKDELLVIKNARCWNMLSINALTDADCELYDYWESMLAYAWETNEWHDNLITLTEIINKNFTILRNFYRTEYKDYMNYHRFDTLGRGAQFAVKHPFHGGKYENTIRQSPDKKSLLVPTAGDAILRLLSAVVVDAIDADWERHNIRLSIFIRDGPSCEAKAAKEAVQDEYLAILFDKMGVGSWVPVDSSKLNEHEKANIMEYLVVRLYETKMTI